MTTPTCRLGRAALLAMTTGLIALPALAQEVTLTIARGVDADGLDPYKVSTTQSSQMTGLIYDTLVTLDETGGVNPGLATEHSLSDDNLTYTFTIREGVACHDGAPFTADDVVWSFTRALAPETANPRRANWGPIESVSAEGNVVTVTLEEPFGPFLSYLGSYSTPMMCQSAIAEDGSYTPVGTGAFRLVDWVRNDRMTFVANDEYQNFNPLVQNPGRPHIDRLVVQVIPEAVARMAALRSGEVDMAEPSLEEAASMQADPAFNVYISDLSGQQVVAAFTWRREPFDNVEVRRALGMAMNRNAYAEIAYEGLVNPTTCPAAPGLVGIDLELCAGWGVSYDPDGARAIMEGLGYTTANPLEITLSVHALPGFDQMHQIMQQDLREIGVNAEIESREVAAFFDHMRNENIAEGGRPVLWTMGQSGVDSDYLTYLWRTPGFINMGIGEPLDTILTEQRVLSGEARVAKLQEAQQYLLENVYAVPLVSPGWNWLWASGSHITGFRTGFAAALYFNDVSLGG